MRKLHLVSVGNTTKQWKRMWLLQLVEFSITGQPGICVFLRHHIIHLLERKLS